MGECALCSRSGDDISLLTANHKELGRVKVCQDCWTKLYQENGIVSGSTCSGNCSCCR